jgi:hypothetical protein
MALLYLVRIFGAALGGSRRTSRAPLLARGHRSL